MLFKQRYFFMKRFLVRIIRLSTFICIFCLITPSLAQSVQGLDGRMQTSIDYYLGHEGKGEGVTGIAATVSTPVANKPRVNFNRTYVTGKIGYPPLTAAMSPNNL